MRIFCTVVLLAVLGACAVPDRTIAPAPSIPTMPALPQATTADVPAPHAPVATPSPEPAKAGTTKAATSKPQTSSSSPTLPPVKAYKNCTEVNAAGKGPIRRGDPGFADWLDTDGDGIACYPRKR
nr:excalibur calcium-binding domain-containing protein [Kibdelosporangium sp. MJ126-NF4]CTQ94359.1 hypothetical protein [Kibdelosporangium sp. MJ126-NF4]